MAFGKALQGICRSALISARSQLREKAPRPGTSLSQQGKQMPSQTSVAFQHVNDGSPRDPNCRLGVCLGKDWRPFRAQGKEARRGEGTCLRSSCSRDGGDPSSVPHAGHGGSLSASLSYDAWVETQQGRGTA
ncbi:hypothetical protein KIL84_020927 [Mauremys mutica]|uniref:Uncharacterized protein n=1 Tax=Mauremys mutica TaxID=74926 RepID=A0A9D3XAR5_9SAUR|nr:hypothetical protein KIL84_020927 [Mauremys mutica]